MGHEWHLYIGMSGGSPVERVYKDIRFTRSLSAEPTSCTLTIKYVTGINKFDPIKITSNKPSGSVGTEWYGYVERIKIFWDETGRLMEIHGRDRKLIPWKKWSERFTEMRNVNDEIEDTGFFGSVNAVELIKFLLRCPTSDSVIDSDGEPILNHKIGWGIAPNNWMVRASPTIEICEPEWVKARYSGLAWKNRGTPYINTTLHVDGVTAGGTPWTKVGTTPYIKEEVGGEPSETDKVYSSTYDASDEYTFDDLGGSAISINEVRLRVWISVAGNANPFLHGNGHLYLYRASSDTWLKIKEWYGSAWNDGKPHFYNLNVTGTLDTVENVNGVKLKIVNKSSELASHVWSAALTVNYACCGSQEVGDYFTVDFYDSQDYVMGIYIESRKSQDQYARNYSIMYSNASNPDPTNEGDWTDFTAAVNVSNNTFRDIIHSWRPVTLRHIRIKITAQTAGYGWEISQIYVYRTEELKYRILLDGETPPADPPPYLGGPYLGGYQIESYATPLTKLNLPYGRLSETIDIVVKRMHYLYTPYDWWIDYDDGTIKTSQDRGTDKSSEIYFLKGVHLGGTTKEEYIGDTVQRIRVVGKSGDKRQDNITSEWINETDEMDNVRSFYEEIISEKTVSSREISTLLAYINLAQKSGVEETIECHVEDDRYDSMAYDVGDVVTIIDSLTGTNDAYRIQTIEKTIDNRGEHVVIYLGNKLKDITDEWIKIERKIRELSLSATALDDLLSEGSEQTKIDSENTTDDFEVNAKNDFEDASKDSANWTTLYDGSPTPSGGMLFTQSDKWIEIWGVNTYYAGTKALVAYINTPPVKLNQNPKTVFEFKINIEDSSWRDEDYFRIGVSNDQAEGIAFIIHKEAGSYNLYAWLYDSYTSPSKFLIQPLFEDVKYRLEAVTDWENRVVKYYLQDPDSPSKELEFRGLLQIPETCSPETFSMYPTYFVFITQTDNPADGQHSKLFVYKYRAEWKAKQ